MLTETGHRRHRESTRTVLLAAAYDGCMSRWSTLRFDGHIAGAGTSGGTRIVLGHWVRSPQGPFSDVMVQHPDGTRMLLAPNPWVAEFVSSTYTFDEVMEVPVEVEAARSGERAVWKVRAGPLAWEFAVGPRPALGHLLRVIPAPIARSLTFARLSNPIARLMMPGVQTVGTAGNERTEWYAAHDLRTLRASAASWDGVDLGSLTDVDPPTQFGFSSTPRQPSLTTVTSTVRVPRCPIGPTYGSPSG